MFREASARSATLHGTDTRLYYMPERIFVHQDIIGDMFRSEKVGIKHFVVVSFFDFKDVSIFIQCF